MKIQRRRRGEAAKKPNDGSRELTQIRIKPSQVRHCHIIRTDMRWRKTGGRVSSGELDLTGTLLLRES